jgi:AraC family transcriptional regulator
MKSIISINTYYQSVNKVFEFIEENLTDDLRLNALSSVSGYSEFHFHRIFHAMTGKSLREYVQERRLVAAASRLLYDRTATITGIALDCGFSASGSFTRSFSRYFGCSPSEYRKNKERKRPLEFHDTLHMEYPPDPEKDKRFFVSELPDLHVAGIAAQGLSPEFENKDIEDAFERLFGWLRLRGLVKEGVRIMGITMDTPEVLPMSECRYFACASTDVGVEPEGEVFVRMMPTKGKYICFTLERNQPDFASIFFGLTDYLYGCYLPQIGCYPDNRPFVEFYRQNGPAVEITFCVPVK